jgi:hypothetical protein
VRSVGQEAIVSVIAVGKAPERLVKGLYQGAISCGTFVTGSCIARLLISMCAAWRAKIAPTLPEQICRWPESFTNDCGRYHHLENYAQSFPSLLNLR